MMTAVGVGVSSFGVTVWFSVALFVVTQINGVAGFALPPRRSAAAGTGLLASTSRPSLLTALASSVKTADELEQSEARKELWKEISKLERQAVELLSTTGSDGGSEQAMDDAMKLLSKSVGLKRNDPFLKLATEYSIAHGDGNTAECERIMTEMRTAGLPPHISSLVKAGGDAASADAVGLEELGEPEDVDPGSTFSDTVTEKVRVKVNSFYDEEKSDPSNGKYMFWYKVAIYNEGPEPVQIVARMWEIEKCRGDKEVVRGAGIMSTQPIIPPGDVFTYQSVCPLKVFPPKGKRVLGSMSGAYTMCKGNMGQHHFSVKVSKFNLILPEKVVAV